MNFDRKRMALKSTFWPQFKSRIFKALFFSSIALIIVPEKYSNAAELPVASKVWLAQSQSLKTQRTNYLALRNNRLLEAIEAVRADSSLSPEVRVLFNDNLNKKLNEIKKYSVEVSTKKSTWELVPEPSFKNSFRDGWSSFLELAVSFERLAAIKNGEIAKAELLKSLVTKRLTASERFSQDSYEHQIDDVLTAAHLNQIKLEDYFFSLDSNRPLNFLGNGAFSIPDSSGNSVGELNLSKVIGDELASDLKVRDSIQLQIKELESGPRTPGVDKQIAELKAKANALYETINQSLNFSYNFLSDGFRIEILAEGKALDSGVQSLGFQSQPLNEGTNPAVTYSQSMNLRLSPSIFRPLVLFITQSQGSLLTNSCDLNCNIKRIDDLSKDISTISSATSSVEEIYIVHDKYKNLYPSSVITNEASDLKGLLK